MEETSSGVMGGGASSGDDHSVIRFGYEPHPPPNIKEIEERTKVARSIAKYWASPWRTPQTPQQIEAWRLALASDTSKMLTTIEWLEARLRQALREDKD